MKRVGERVGRFKLLEHLGTGGMGDVFAGRDERLDREVAIKAIRPEHLTAEVRERLVREAQLLSALDHENICRIYELIEEQDETFLILELIRGQDLRQLLEQELSFERRLELAERIAVALDVAHRRGIIHRDLKLENVMLRDDGVLKVLDFGVARSIGDASVSRGAGPDGAGPDGAGPDGAGPDGAGPGGTGPDGAAPEAAVPRVSSPAVLTVWGQTVGTVATMSPEQARGEDVGTASDLYSLGLMLQEFFTGRSPYPVGLEDHVVWLRACDADTLPVDGIDAELAALIRELKAPSPHARPTASDTARRIRRIRRRGVRRLRLAATVAALLLVIAGTVKYTIDLRRERNAAVEARLEAERRGEESEAVVDFLVRLFEASDPGQARGHDPKASELLAIGDARIESELQDQPLVRARLMETIAYVNRMVGQIDRAGQLFEAALEVRRAEAPDEFADIARLEMERGDVLRLLGRHDASRTALEASLAMLESAELEQDPLYVGSLNRLGALDLGDGRFEEAADAFQRVIAARMEAGEDSADSLVMAARNNLAIALLQLGRLEDAAAEHRRVLEVRRRTLGDDHPDVGTSLNNLAVVSYLQKDLAASESYLLEALAIWRQSFGEQHPEVATVIYNLGDLARERGELELAEQRFQDSLGIWRTVFDDQHPDLAYAWQGLGQVARERGRLGEAEEAFSKALAIREAALGADHPETVAVRKDWQSTVGD